MNMMEQIWAIRDSRGLNSYDKIFLVTVAARGADGMYCKWERNKDDMGMGKDRYYKSRDSLLEQKLITATRRMDSTTVYHINDEALTDLVSHSATQNDSATQNELSATQNGHSVRPETKKNLKKNIKKNINESAGASSLPLDKNKNDKEDQDAPASPIVENLPAPADPIEETTATGLSATQNEDDYYVVNGRKIRRAGTGDPFEGATAPVEKEEKTACPRCNVPMDNDLCWNMACAA